MSLVTLPLGITVVVSSARVQQFVYDYTYCVDSSWNGHFRYNWTSNARATYSSCADWVNDRRATSKFRTCQCVIDFTLNESIPAPVNLYYGLTNFYQNHRKIWRSRDDVQLSGVQMSSVSRFCSLNNSEPTAPFSAPCGEMANAIWNDSLALFYYNQSDYVEVPFLSNNLISYYDCLKYRNPSGANATLKWANTLKPPNWPLPIDILGYDQATTNVSVNGSFELVTDWSQVGYQYHRFVNWMHSSALPSFMKLYGRLDDSDATFSSGLPSGIYQMQISYAYPVASFGGGKQFILATSSRLGGNFPLIGVLLILVGSVYLVASCGFFIAHLRISRQLLQKGLNHDDFDPETDLNL